MPNIENGPPIQRISEFNSDLRTEFEILYALEPTTKRLFTEMYVEPADLWQPSDLTPKTPEAVFEYQKMSKGVPAWLWVAFAGNVATEEGISHFFKDLYMIYQAGNPEPDKKLSLLEFADYWMSQEYRHGVLGNNLLLLSGQVNMHQLEADVQQFNINGVDTRTRGIPSRALIYTTYQERAARYAHRNTATAFKKAGNPIAARASAEIAGEEKPHEDFYTPLFGAFLDIDPNQGIISFNEMMQQRIAMPGARMPYFDEFAAVAHGFGIYTAEDYMNIFGHLIKVWKIEERSVQGEAARAQEQVIRTYEKNKGRLDEIMTRRTLREYKEGVHIPWVNETIYIPGTGNLTENSFTAF